jgi:hypothetical protein
LGNFPEDVNVNDLALKIDIMRENSLQTQTTITLLREPKKKKKRAISSISKKFNRIPHIQQNLTYGSQITV